MQIICTKIRRIKSSLKRLSLISLRLISFPKSKKTETCIYFFPKSIFFNFQKTPFFFVETYLDIWHAIFQVDISTFGKHLAQKPYTLMMSSFQTAILNISRRRRQNKNDLFGIRRSNLLRTPLFYFKKSKIWAYMTRGWPDPSPSLIRMQSYCKIASVFEFCLQKWL